MRAKDLNYATRRHFLKGGLGVVVGATLSPLETLAGFLGGPAQDSPFNQHWVLAQGGDFLNLRAREAGRLGARVRYVLKHGDRVLEPLEIQILAPHLVRVRFAGAEIIETWRGTRDWVVAHRAFTIREPGRWRLSFSMEPELRSPHMSVPAVNYFGNGPGVGDFPRGERERNWSFREDRTPLPSWGVIHSQDHAQSIFCSPARTEGELTSVQIDPDKIAIWMPMGEGPTRYITKGIVRPGMAGPTEFAFEITRAELPWRMARDFCFVDGPTDHFADAYEQATRAFHSSGLASSGPARGPSHSLPWAEIRRLKYRHMDDLFVETGAVAGLRMGVGNGLVQGYYERTAGSFLVLSLDAAVLWMNEGLRTDNPALVERARRIGRFFLCGRLPNGLHQDSYDFGSGQWSSFMTPAISSQWNAGANARCNAETMQAYLALARGLESLDRRGPKDPDATVFRETVAACARFYVSHQLPSGSFGRYWSREGKVLDSQGTNGAHILSLLIACERELGPDIERQNAIVRAAGYYRGMAARGEFSGDALDSDCYDREAGVALLTALLDVHAVSGDPEMLAGALESARFLLSWTWQYAVPFAPHSELGRAQFSTQGMTAVSVAHPHLDFYGLGIAVQFLRLARATGDTFWSDQAHQMAVACRQLIATHGLLPGSQPEQIMHTDWTFIAGLSKERGESSTYIAWVAVWTLKALERLMAEFPEALKR